MMRLLAAAMLALGLSACATNPYPGEPASAHDQERIDQDIFVMGIDAGRMGIFIDRIKDAAGMVEAPALGGDELIGVMRSVRITALEFLATKETLCKEAKFVDQSCAKVTPPRWLADDPSGKVTTQQVAARIEDVQILMVPLIDVACEAGKAKSGDGMFCSVE
jgi:hypothetical protein